ncbi:MAG TPA: WecB/TagA/CpsF family glycosyltransferase [Candidatus Saccharimonadales bacterium]|nr:WecB/TagA/CpsF family glycosyltransferase [Candidatus Saccharimonadales bacterium]
MLQKNQILGVGITNETEDNILEYIIQELKSDKKKLFITTPNPEILVKASKNPDFKKILNEAEIAIPDGTGLFLASILMLKPFKQRIPGVDFIDFICKNTVDFPISMGFLGGREKIAEKTAERLLKKYPHLDVVFAGSDWNDEGFRVAEAFRKTTQNRTQKNAEDNGVVPRIVSRSSALSHPKQDSDSSFHKKEIDLLFVAYGAPKQEEWIYKNLDKIPVKAAMGVGGAFDYISGEVSRAPIFIRLIGFEWLYRLVREPWRWRRQLALITFTKLVIKERFNK